MTPTIRRQALLAATKVTLVLTAAACGGIAQSEMATDDAYSRRDAGDRDAHSTPKDAGKHDANSTAKDAASAACNVSYDEKGIANDSSFQCCVEDLGKQISDVATKNGWIEHAVSHTPPNRECCRAILHGYYERQWQEDAGDWKEPQRVFGSCCETFINPVDGIAPNDVDQGERIACSPWGPPVPPSFGVRLKRFRAELLEVA